MSKSLWDLLVAAGEADMTRGEFGKIMHDPNATYDEKQEALDKMADAGGYDCLPED